MALACLLLAVAVTRVLAHPGLLGGDPPMLGPQENARLVLGQEWAREGRPSRPLHVPEGLPEDAVVALTPRDAAVRDGAVLPKDFPYAVALAAALARVDPRLPLAISTVSALGLLTAVAALARRHGGRWSGVAAAALLTTTGAFTSGTSGPLNTSATAAAAVVLAVLLLLPPEDADREPLPLPTGTAAMAAGRDLAAGMLLGVSLHLRHDLVLLAAGLLLPLVLSAPAPLRRTARLAAGGLLAVLPGLAYNAWLYGSPWTTGYAVGAQALAIPGEPYFALLTLNPRPLLDHVAHYVARLEVVLLLVGALLVVGAAPPRPVRALAWGLALGGVPYLVFVGARPLYGVEEPTLGASFLRYALPVVALLAVVCTARAPRLSPLARRCRAAALLLAALVGAVLVVRSPGGLLDQRRQVLQSDLLREQVLALTEPDAVVVTGRGDKVLWPRRTTLTAAYLIRRPEEAVRYGPITYDVVPTPRRLAAVVAELTRAGQPVYLLSDALPRHVGGLDLELRLAGVEREVTASRRLFRIRAASPSGS